MLTDDKSMTGAGAGELVAASFSRFPQFVSSPPKLYFIQMDAFMKLNKVTTDETKFQYICAMTPSALHNFMLEVVNDKTSAADRKKSQYEQFKSSRVLTDRRKVELENGYNDTA